MSLAHRVRVKTCYTRATNVERDSGNLATVAAYCPTARGMALLEEVGDALGKGNKPRAWSLIGPYGSGKSSFGVFLHALLGDDAASTEAAKVLGRQSRPLAARFRRAKPWCRVVLTGSPEPLSCRLLTAMAAAASAFWQGRPGRKPHVLQNIEAACAAKRVAESHVLALVDGLQAALERSGAGGLLFVIDELGKFLEFEARGRTGNMGSTYVLQELAERTYLGRKTNLMLFVLQHQAFDMYAAGMDQRLQDEWAKVQGRFQTVSFVETTEQTLRVLAAAFEHDLTELEQNRIREWSAKSAEALADANALPVGLAQGAAAQLFTACYPMHPVSLLALPVLCARFAQNERTLFSYFGSNEPHGFQQAVEHLGHFGEWVLPGDIYDYFVQTQPPALAAPLAQRTWAEVVTAVDRAERAEQEAPAGNSRGDLTALVKAVGLLNLTSGSQGLPATEAVLGQLFETKDAFVQAIAAPVAASILQYRKFADEYRVWQGTDFNIDEHIARERDKLGRIDLARTLTERGETPPIVARRHSIETGALRAFHVAYADAGSGRPEESPGNGARVVFFLAENRADEAVFRSGLKDTKAGDIWVLHPNGAALRAAIVGVLALEGVQQGAQEVASDPVAAREVKEQLKAARAVEQQAMNALLRDPAASKWYWQGSRLHVLERRTLQTALSDVMDRIYPDSPKVRNELISRDRLSSQAAAARNKLFGAMLDRADQPSLGIAIAKYPPERAIYRSVLERGGLHAQDESGDWQLAPPPEADPLHLRPTWVRLDALFEASEALPVSAKHLMDDLAAPPIGLKRGVFPLIFLHYYLLNRREIAFYDEGAYSPALTYEHLERLVRRPDLFTFQRFRVAGVRAMLFDEYSKALFGEKRDSLAVLDLARPLANFLLRLPEYTRKTRHLSETALLVREALALAKSPEKLLFDHLPEACGHGDQAKTAGFAETLIGALRELDGTYAAMLDELRRTLCASFGCAADTEIGELRSVAMGRCHGLDSYTVDAKGLKSFMRRAMARDRSDLDWLEHVLTFLGQKPPGKWTDQDRSTAEYRLAEYSVRLLDLQRLKLYYDGKGAIATEDMDVILLKTLSREHGEIDETVPIDERMEIAIAEAKRRLEEVLEEVGDDRLRLALVATMAQDYLAARRRAAVKERGERGLRRVG